MAPSEETVFEKTFKFKQMLNMQSESKFYTSQFQSLWKQAARFQLCGNLFFFTILGTQLQSVKFCFNIYYMFKPWASILCNFLLAILLHEKYPPPAPSPPSLIWLIYYCPVQFMLLFLFCFNGVLPPFSS